jgi:hypothetical protein
MRAEPKVRAPRDPHGPGPKSDVCPADQPFRVPRRGYARHMRLAEAQGGAPMEHERNFSLYERESSKRQRAEDVAGLARYLALESSANEDPMRLASELREWADSDPEVLRLALRYEHAGDGHPDRAVQLLSRATGTSRAA